MAELSLTAARIAAMSPAAIEQVRRLESAALALPQVPIETTHVLHAGLYARTIRVPAGVLITGALIKIATLLVIDGDVLMHVEGGAVRLEGHHVLPAAAGRKQAFLARSDTHITMVFATAARSIEEAERQFTDEVENLVSRHEPNRVIITGD